MRNPTRMFSMNMPVDVHRALKRETFERDTTMGGARVVGNALQMLESGVSRPRSWRD